MKFEAILRAKCAAVILNTINSNVVVRVEVFSGKGPIGSNESFTDLSSGEYTSSWIIEGQRYSAQGNDSITSIFCSSSA